jgi:hypothetical protein
VTPAALRRLALALPGTHEEPHFERTSFRVGKKIFATMTSDGREAMVRVADPDERDALLTGEPGVFFSYGGWTERYGALGIRLAKVRLPRMRGLVVGAWRNIAPKRVIAAWDAAGG